jgi:nucleotide-binding universal stress UspA family protein
MEPADPAQQAPILVAFDPHSGDREAVEFGIAASEFIGAPVVVAAVFSGGRVVERTAGAAEQREPTDSATLNHLGLDLERRGIKVEMRAFESASVGPALTQAIDDASPQLVVLGATRHGATHSALMGSTIQSVIQHATGPVAIVPHGYQRPSQGIKTVGAAYAPTEEGLDALRVGAGLARVGGVKFKAIQVLDPKHAAQQSHGLLAEQHHEVTEEETGSAAKRLRDVDHFQSLVGDLADGLDAELDTLYNDPADGLLAAAGHVDLLVMGSRGRGGRRSVIFGSVSRKVAEQAPCPVVIVPRGHGEAAEQVVSNAAAHGTPR